MNSDCTRFEQSMTPTKVLTVIGKPANVDQGIATNHMMAKQKVRKQHKVDRQMD